MQVKLLRVLQERRVRPVGADADRPVDVRVLAATNRDLRAEVAAGRFREDLYYRLRVVEVTVPPLRERRDDILPLARRIAEDASRRIGQRPARLSATAADRLLSYAWPGNVREMVNAIERAIVVHEGDTIEVEDLPPELRAAPDVAPGAAATLRDVEEAHLRAVLASNGGDRRAAARVLGVGLATLYRRLPPERPAPAPKRRR
jgi:transcriptional regulator with PAS, ATPase and Fis domain